MFSLVMKLLVLVVDTSVVLFVNVDDYIIVYTYVCCSVVLCDVMSVQQVPVIVASYVFCHQVIVGVN